ncbi:MAG: heme o synthase [Planctomycetota bacterium]|nr:heme o synthase [Planctomycetota bacterium]MDA1180151.1 heme o synthase [Planctomycetota bacterium]
MTTSTLSVATTRRAVWSARLRDLAELTKPRIVTMVLFSVGASAMVASWGQPDPSVVLHAVLGTVLIAASGSILNQWLERDTDARMARTADRPMVNGRLGVTEALALASMCGLTGFLYLIWKTNYWTAVWGAGTWLLYVVAYTPLKRHTAWNTAVGALSGAMPIWIGWAAVGGRPELRAIAMFLLVFFWQFPHFMAIAWLYRQQYARAGIQVATVTDPTGRLAGVQAVLGAISLLPVTMVFAIAEPEAKPYLAIACLLGVIQVYFAWIFFRRPDEISARTLLRMSLIYLPTVLACVAASPWG